MTWTPEKITDLKRLWDEGLSTAVIGSQLDITKNSVVGKARRLGLAPRPSPIRRREVPEELKVVAIVARGTGGCQWPFGDPGHDNFHFCGQSPIVAGKPYCAEHCARAYVRSEPRHSSRAA